MKMDKEDNSRRLNLQSIFFACFLGLSFLSILFQFFLKNVIVDVLHIKNSFVVETISSLEESLYAPERIDVDWEARYHFPGQPEYSQLDLPEGIEKADDAMSLLEQGKDRIEKYSSRYFSFKDELAYLANEFNRLIGMKLIEKSLGQMIIFMDNGHFARESPSIDVKKIAENVVSFNYWLQTRGTDFVYIQCPGPVDKRDKQVPPGYTEYSNENADKLLHCLRGRGISIIDLREELERQNKKKYERFLVTDHHWKPETGLWAAGEVARQLNDKLNYSIDETLFEEEEYTIKVYSDAYMGTFGRQLTEAFVKPDDMALILPRFQTAFHIGIPTIVGMNKEGTFAETMIDWSEWPDYKAYYYGLNPIVEIQNFREEAEDKRVLIITDSMQEVVTPYLACAFKQIVSMDLRWFSGSVETYIKEYDPELVLIMYAPMEITESPGECYMFK